MIPQIAHADTHELVCVGIYQEAICTFIALFTTLYDFVLCQEGDMVFKIPGTPEIRQRQSGILRSAG